MPDRGTFWAAPIDTTSATITAEGLHISILPRQNYLLVSGNLAAFAAVAGTPAGAFSLARGRILVPASLPEGLACGWDARGFAVSDATALYQTVRVDGDAARALLARGTVSDPDEASGSQAHVFAGQRLIIRPDGAGYLVLVEAPLLQWLWSWLTAACAAMN